MSRKTILRNRVVLKNTRTGHVEHSKATGEEVRLSKRETDFDLRTPEQVLPQTPAPSLSSHNMNQVGNSIEDITKTEKHHLHRSRDPTSKTQANTDIEAGKPFYNKTTKTQTAPSSNAISDSPPATVHSNNPKPGVHKTGKLQFTSEETSNDTSKPLINRKYANAQKQAEKANSRLENARKNLPAKRRLRMISITDDESGMIKRRLQFKKIPLSQREHITGPLLLRPVKAAGNNLLMNTHRKLYQVEHENVSIKAAHRGELLAEGVIRSVLSLRKTAPYRHMAKLERVARKKSINLAYQKVLAENPKLNSNFLMRAIQKYKIKKDYAKAARATQMAAKNLHTAGSALTQASQAVLNTVRRNPIVAGTIILIALFLFTLMSLIGALGSLGNGGLGGILTASYLANEGDIDQAEVAYTEWETDLQLLITDIENSRPGFDEYRYVIGAISHNPYELMAYLTVVYQNFTFDGITDELRLLFDEQYSFTFSVTRETRYADPDDANKDGDYEPYDWIILTTTLNSKSFSDVALSHLNNNQLAHFALLLQTKGSRQLFGNPFGFDWLPYITSYYGYRIHPISGKKDLHQGVDISFAAGTEILSTQDGKVTFAGYSGDYGNVVVIENNKGLSSKYAHCENLLVALGQTVIIGDTIATVGNTGSSTGAHLHLEVLKNGQYLNPLYFTDTGTFNLSPIYGFAYAPMGDGTYAALLAEAEKYLGYPYVWGGSNPVTSFDCSGYVSWVLTHSGVKNIGRLTAQGLYNICTPVSPADARPGDLIFFHSTYSASTPVTHVGIYVGGDKMLHCGNPIQYTSIVTAYWQNHFYAFGRI